MERVADIGYFRIARNGWAPAHKPNFDLCFLAVFLEDDADMTASSGLTHSLLGAWDVFVLFVIPIGGGIPAGVLLAKSKNIAWPIMEILYFISDVALACAFDPIMHFMIRTGKRIPAVAKMKDALKQSVQKTTSGYGTRLGPFSLIMISFGVDPMTGRAATLMAGHGFVTGWALAIAGDMIYFSLIMVSTLWLNSILGNGTMATLIILVVMMVVPALIRRMRERKLVFKT
jgi:hypothetical protein